MTTENLNQKLSGMRGNREDRRALRELFQAIRTAFLVGSATYDAASLADGVGATSTITVTGAALGDFAIVSAGVDAASLTITAYVSAANTVSFRIQNESTGAVDLASTTFRALVIKKASFDGTYMAGMRL